VSSDETRQSVHRWRKGIRDHPGLSANAKHLALTLATYMDARLVCWPSVATLAAGMSRHERTVQGAITELEEAEVIEVRPGGGRRNTNTYLGVEIEPLLNGGDMPGFVSAEVESPAALPKTPVSSPETPVLSTGNGGATPPEVVVESVTEVVVESVTEQSSQGGAAPDGDGACAAGFFHQKLEQLKARHPDLLRSVEA
jgi:Helix-turn-helix domain